ncbi:poly(3-hydroxybutyrate) depolymerase [Bradyrhizobium sp. LB9.1b]
MMSMYYQAFQNHMDLTAPWRSGASSALQFLNLVPQGLSDQVVGRLSAALELISRSTLTYHRPAYGIDSVMVGNREVGITEEVAYATPFGSLLHFKKDGAPEQPPMLLVAPMSGHFATLLRGTVKTLLQDHDVYITDWHNPRDISRSEGRFGLDDYTDHLVDFLGQLGPRPHMVAICQPSVSALAAAAIMCEGNHPSRPATLTLMAGPIDTRIQPTRVNEFAKSRPIDWFEQNLINYVPMQCRGALRKVYPGFVQLTAFVSMNLERHIKQHMDLANHIAKGEKDKAASIKTFYDEYFAVMDLPAEFYIETVRDVFQEHLLPQGKLMHRGTSGEHQGRQPHGADDDRGREGRYLLDRPDTRGARPLHRRARLSPRPPHAGRRRPLRRVLGQALEQRDLSAAAGFRAREFLKARRERLRPRHAWRLAARLLT